MIFFYRMMNLATQHLNQIHNQSLCFQHSTVSASNFNRVFLQTIFQEVNCSFLDRGLQMLAQKFIGAQEFSLDVEEGKNV